MFVVGATKTEQLAEVRAMLPDHFFLVPGVGAQGGSIEEVSQQAMNQDIGLLINASRQILLPVQAIFFVPMFFVVIQGFFGRKPKEEAPVQSDYEL